MMSTKVEQLLRTGAANMANSLGQGANRSASTLPAYSGPDRFTGRTKGNAGEMLIENIIPDPDQPRSEFSAVEMQQLVESLKTHGQLQPIRVRWCSSRAKWIIIAGERRYRAAQAAGFTKLACVFVEDEMSADTLLEEQLIENAIRLDLKPIEQARAFRRLMDMKDWTGKQVAERLHLHPTSVTRALQLLDLPETVQTHIDEGRLATSVGVNLTKITDEEEQSQVAELIVAKQLSRSEAAEVVKIRKGTAEKGRREKKDSAKNKNLTFRTKDRVTVTLNFKKVPSDDDVRRALEEVLGIVGKREKEAA